MASLILLSDTYEDGTMIGPKGVNIQACGKIYNFRVHDITDVPNEVAGRVAKKFAARGNLDLVNYNGRLHKKYLLDAQSIGDSEAELNLIVKTRQEFPRKDLLLVDQHTLAGLALRLGIFSEMSQADFLPLSSLRHVVLAKLGYKIPKEKKVEDKVSE